MPCCASPPCEKTSGFSRRGSVSPSTSGRGEFFGHLWQAACEDQRFCGMLDEFETPNKAALLRRKGHRTCPAHPQPVKPACSETTRCLPISTCAGNIAFGLRRSRMPPAAIDTRVAEMVRWSSSMALRGAKPDQLSRGQKATRGVARSLGAGRSLAARRAARRARTRSGAKAPR